MRNAARRLTAKEFADRLVEWVSCVTQLDPEKNELPNVEAWHANAEKLYQGQMDLVDLPS